jgi:hypothetical protein
VKRKGTWVYILAASWIICIIAGIIGQDWKFSTLATMGLATLSLTDRVITQQRRQIRALNQHLDILNRRNQTLERLRVRGE